MEERRLCVDEGQLSIERDRDRLINTHWARQHKHDKKRMRLDEKHIQLEEQNAALERDESREVLKERKTMIAMLGVLF